MAPSDRTSHEADEHEAPQRGAVEHGLLTAPSSMSPSSIAPGAAPGGRSRRRIGVGSQESAARSEGPSWAELPEKLRLQCRRDGLRNNIQHLWRALFQ